MSGIHVISASAGTGKTTRLAKELKQALQSGEARPEAILATTFTRKAAAELQERARGALIQAGRPDDAQRLGAARIGTVNSVCGSLVKDYAFELGLSPDVKVVDEKVSGRMLREVLAQALTAEDEALLADLTTRIEPLRKSDDDGWQRVLLNVVEHARANGLDEQGLRESEERSVAELHALLPTSGDAQEIDESLRGALEHFAKVFPTLPKPTKDALESAGKVDLALEDLRLGRTPSWSRRVALTKIKMGSAKKHPEATKLADAVIVAALRDLEHPQLRKDLEDYVRLVFRLASQALAAYARRKREAGIIDFIDQETQALSLLDRPAVRERLSDELDLMLVDEFQDTSPLQLAIFLKLAGLARRTVWVGDQKQAIFGFRGADPSLMLAALDAIENAKDGPLAGGRTEPLSQSWRSRPELVRLTSDVFVEAFARHGMKEELVRIEPGLTDEAKDLGPVVELWPLGPSTRTLTNENKAASVAAAVKRLLDDPTVMVRDRTTNESRRIRPGDVAVLTRDNKKNAAIADALLEVGLRSVLPRNGLVLTLEGHVLHAALRVWVSSYDRLPRAELSRLLDGAENEERWLAELVARTPPSPDDGSKRPHVSEAEQPDGLAARIIGSIEACRNQRPTAGAVEALEHCLEATNLRERALEWGSSAQRVANLDALRALAVRWVELRAAEGRAATPEGLVAHLDSIAGKADAQDAEADDQAVTISTWHSSKGLEWPVTVLYAPDKPRTDQAWGANVVSDGAFDPTAPLRGRWIRFWPDIYGGNTHAPLRDRMNAEAVVQPQLDARRRENLRLLYVGWTRARDRLVLAANNKGFLDGDLSVLRAADASCLLQEPAAKSTWAGRPVEALVRDTSFLEAATAPVEPSPGVIAVGVRAHPPARVSPSKLEETGSVTWEHDLGARIPAHADSDQMNRVGTAFHKFLAADVPGLPDEERLAIARIQLDANTVAHALQTQDMLDASTRFTAFVDARWPGAVWHREWPVSLRNDDGSLLTGTADLVLETDAGFVVVDHKTFPGSSDTAREKAAGFAGQLSAYGRAITRATSKPVLDTVVHLPVVGLVCGVAAERLVTPAAVERSA